MKAFMVVAVIIMALLAFMWPETTEKDAAAELCRQVAKVHKIPVGEWVWMVAGNSTWNGSQVIVDCHIVSWFNESDVRRIGNVSLD
jgi:hypothetical protein